jgi:hypothetical protein
MINATVQSRILNLLRQSRQAVRLYASVRHLEASPVSQLAKVQSEQWRLANEQLCKQLGNLLRNPTNGGNQTTNLTSNNHVPTTQTLGQVIKQIREEFRQAWRQTEHELHETHLQLGKAVDRADYITSAILSKDLVQLQARKEAQSAVYEELTSLLRSCKISVASSQRTGDKYLTATPVLEANNDDLVIG